MSRSSLSDLLDTRPWLLADGATGTNYFAMGLASGEAPELWNFAHPEKVRALHRSFIEAGADIILTNSFGGNAHRLKLHKAEGRVREVNREAARLARLEADAAPRPVIVAGSMGPTGEIFEPVGTLTHGEGVAAFAEQAKALAEGGADVLWIETMSAEEELRAAVEGASAAGPPIVATMSFDTNGCTMMGITPGYFGLFSQSLPGPVAAVGANCGTGAAELVATVLGIAGARPDAVVVAKGNCGIPEFHDGHIHYSGTPTLMADYARLARDAGARIIGGCCGTTSEHLRAMRAALEAHAKGHRPAIADIEERLGKVSALAHGEDKAGDARQRREGRERRRRG
jgi:5-methyltetrahydrofolate--homocysteine methyltransferase